MPDEIELNDDFTQQANDNAPIFKLVPATDLTKQPAPIGWLIRNYIPEAAMIEIFGAPGSGKSFVALDMVFCIANGLGWHDHDTKPGTVIYLAGEGFAGIGQRLRALEIKYDLKAENLIVSQQPASLTDEQNAAWVADAIRQHEPVLIVIDTLSRNFGAGDENSTRDMNAFISNLDLHIRGNAAVLIVHHSGHAEKGRARGSSVLFGAVDVEYSIIKSENTLTMTNTKAKDFEPPKPLSFELKQQALDWRDDQGDPVKSAILELTEWQPPKDSKPRLSARNEAILTALERAIELHGIKPDKEITERFGGFGIGSGRRVVHVDHWRKEAYPVIDVDSDGGESEAKRKAFNRAKDALRKNYVQTMNGYWWVIYE